MTALAASYCVVGLGAHARTKIVPALAAAGARLAGVVTSSVDAAGAEQRFSSLQAALAALPRETVFFLATPPALHADQATQILSAGFDLMVEKPAFATAQDAQRITALSTAAGPVLVEAFMYRHTQLYERLMAFWRENRSAIQAVSLRFVIPQMPPGTFRSRMDIASSSLFDIGCYPLSLLQSLEIDAAPLALTHVDNAGNPDQERLEITGVSGGHRIFIEAGVGPAYMNEAHFQGADADVVFAPIFYGRAGARTITRGAVTEPLEDGNAFEAMFRVPRFQWLETQLERNRAMVYQAARLETLGAELSSLRNNALIRNS
jgi:predicted dehydrogenase